MKLSMQIRPIRYLESMPQKASCGWRNMGKAVCVYLIVDGRTSMQPYCSGHFSEPDAADVISLTGSSSTCEISKGE
jgi:hypothetical protein